jgi:hypothetical protein
VDEGWLGWVGGVNIYRRGVSDCEMAEPIEGDVAVIGGLATHGRRGLTQKKVYYNVKLIYWYL